MKIISVVGARPNFMKIAPLCRAIARHNSDPSRVQINHILVHTGQHYDQAMSDGFFKRLSIPSPDVNLGIGSGSHAEQVGHTMIAFEKVVHQYRPDWVVVVGDVNATAACAITAKKEHTKLAHIESGLRSFDMEMPEEINRLVTDRLADVLFTTDDIASDNLRNEGVTEDRISQVGNIMIDTLAAHKPKAERLSLSAIVAGHLQPDCNYQASADFENIVVVTLHRPSNVDDNDSLSAIVAFLLDDLTDKTVIWPVHPRTEQRLKTYGLWDDLCKQPNIILLRPLGYEEMLKLNMQAEIVLTDSGGIQEECCVLGTPCLTLRWNTERPVTLVENGGASILVGNDINRIKNGYRSLISNTGLKPHAPPLWDGGTAERIVAHLVDGI